VAVDTLHGVELRDPYRWLEEQADGRTRDWIAAQNAYAELIVGETPLRDRLRARLRRLMDVPDVGSPTEADGFEYFMMRPAGQELPAIYRRPTPAGESPVPIDPEAPHEVVVDPHPLSPHHRVRVEMRALSPDGRTLIYAVRQGGEDEVELRVRDLDEGTYLDVTLGRALYGSIFFDGRGTGFYYVRRSRETGPRLYHRRMDSVTEADQEIFGNGYGPTTFLNASEHDDGRVLLLTVQHGWAWNEVWIHDVASGVTRPLVVDTPAHFRARWTDGEVFLLTDLDAPNYRLLALDPAHPDRENWREVIPEAEDVLVSYTQLGDRFYATYLRDVSSDIRIFEADGAPAGRIQIPELTTAEIRGAGQGKALLSLSSFQESERVDLMDLATGQQELWRESVARIAGDVVVSQVWYESRDGTRAPMFLVHRPDVELNGDNPTLLYGYGGFTSTLTPRFNATAAVWVEAGGVYAQATLRGGNEFGESWHRAGMLENKQNVFDDFIAAAEWLVDRGYTRPDRLAIRGSSNGGLLVGAALTQRPDLFRAVLCAFPDLDMVRFFTFTETNNMPALLEYGDASDPEHFEFLRAYSPYQAVRDGIDYPAVMLTSGDLDTRVPPLQARKMAARLQRATGSGLPVILRYDNWAGHAAGRGRPISLAVEDTAMELAFLMQQVGLTPEPEPLE
jgi:prolyl oligopeptidase